jgi:hypothetical protein
MKDRIESLIGGLENCIENAKLRGDAYDVGYMSAMVTEARALLADGGKDSSDAERYRKWVSYSGFTKEHCDETLDAIHVNENAAIAKEKK